MAPVEPGETMRARVRVAVGLCVAAFVPGIPPVSRRHRHLAVHRRRGDAAVAGHGPVVRPAGRPAQL